LHAELNLVITLSVSCKDRARNLKTIMLREHVVAPPAFDAITVRLASTGGHCSTADVD
jgi:hypothetical protein